MSKKIILAWMLSLVVTLIVAFPLGVKTGVLAEQSGDTPESGVTSYIKQIYDSLVSLGHGSDSAGAWGDWGEFWNRIRSAGEWEPDGTAEADDVKAGETYFLRQDARLGISSGRVTIKKVNADKGMKEVNGCKLLVSSYISE